MNSICRIPTLTTARRKSLCLCSLLLPSSLPPSSLLPSHPPSHHPSYPPSYPPSPSPFLPPSLPLPPSIPPPSSLPLFLCFGNTHPLTVTPLFTVEISEGTQNMP